MNHPTVSDPRKTFRITSMAFAIPASMIVMSFAFAQRPARRTRARRIPFESGVSRGQMKAQRRR